jgi:pimeloyl-ACP methyl ester carboxylesterase
VVAAGALVLAACSSSDDGRAGAGGGGDRAASTTTEASTPERYTGSVDGFYEVPDPLPAGKPGQLIRVQDLGSKGGRTTVRVMYHSTDATGADRAVTGTITYPDGTPPKGGWPVISTGHGTTGIASRCAPSRSGGEAPGWGVDGVWAMTDYIGLGPVGELHPYLSKTAEGDAMIDIVRAARLLPDAHAGTRWVSIGHSQGGHAALSAHELAGKRAPELHLVATVALSPGAMLDRVYGGIDPIVTAILTMMGVYGGQSEHPDVDVADYLKPEALAAAKAAFEGGCLDEITKALIPVAMGGAFTHDPRTTEPLRSILLANDVGSVAVDGVPLFMASGTKDDRVVIERFRALIDRVCAAGQVTQFTIVDGADHGSIIPAEAQAVTRFIDDALAGKPPVDSCP